MTAFSALNPFDAAIYARLTGDASFMQLVRGVFDDVPETQAFPYVTLGENTENYWDTFGETGVDAMLTLHVWSRYHGYAEAQAIAAALIERLDNQVGVWGLWVTGYTPVLLNYESTQRLRDPDGITRHLVVRFHVMADVGWALFGALANIDPTLNVAGAGGMLMPGVLAAASAVNVAGAGGQKFILSEWWTGAAKIAPRMAAAGVGGMLMPGVLAAAPKMNIAGVGGQRFILTG